MTCAVCVDHQSTSVNPHPNARVQEDLRHLRARFERADLHAQISSIFRTPRRQAHSQQRRWRSRKSYARKLENCSNFNFRPKCDVCPSTLSPATNTNKQSRRPCPRLRAPEPNLARYSYNCEQVAFVLRKPFHFSRLFCLGCFQISRPAPRSRSFLCPRRARTCSGGLGFWAWICSEIRLFSGHV